MRIAGLIAEYNPFHNGHQYHIEKTLALTNADAVIVVMSGDFVQRGMPAIAPKHLRAQMALKAGASLVLELPVCFATGSAESFSYGAVSLLDKLGCVDAICFGSECGDIHTLQNLAKIFCEEPVEYKVALSEYLRQGNSFPTARQKAIAKYLQSDAMDAILSEPNNILGIEYLKALYRLSSSMTPYTIERISSHYHDKKLQEAYSSASAIRTALQTTCFDKDVLRGQMPDSALALLAASYQKNFPIFANDFSLLLKYKLLGESKETLTNYADVSEELANRILNKLNQYEDFEQFCELLKTKEVTYSRISRALLHILLGIPKDTFTSPEYARTLGFQTEAANVLSDIKKNAAIPLLTKLTFADKLSTNAKAMLDMDIFAGNLYGTVIADKFKTPFVHEFEKQVVRV
ncbi:MAG: nucleotidyltransferase [Faecalimonas sp.]|nr:nucleotidyltransferase [Faecalimonas sp.]